MFCQTFPWKRSALNWGNGYADYEHALPAASSGRAANSLKGECRKHAWQQRLHEQVVVNGGAFCDPASVQMLVPVQYCDNKTQQSSPA